MYPLSEKQRERAVLNHCMNELTLQRNSHFHSFSLSHYLSITEIINKRKSV